MKTEQQIQNLRDALVWWKTIPEDRVAPDLSYWTKGRPGFERQDTDCGTVACFGGWCARVPSLQAQGVKLAWYGDPVMEGSYDSSRVALEMFGDEELFRVREEHESDYLKNGNHFKGSDHALVLRRIKHALKEAAQ